MSAKQKVYGVATDGTVITDEVAERLAAEAEAGYDLSTWTIVRRRGRPARQVVSDPDLESRIAVNRELLARGNAERDALIVEALDRDWPQRRVAATLGVGLGTVNRVARQRRGRR